MTAGGGDKESPARDRSPDSTLEFLKEGYSFLPRRFQRYRSDVFETRLMGRRAVCMRGEDATRLFYDPEHFERSTAVPGMIQKTVFGEGGVQMLDGAQHHARKAMFMQVMSAESIQDAVARTVDAWTEALPSWEQADQIVLFDEAQVVLCRAACAWAGVPLAESESRRRAADMTAAVDGFGGVGPRHWRGRLGRLRTEKWMEGIVEETRSGRSAIHETTALNTVVFHRELDGNRLGNRLAAIEVLNLVRPFVAITWFACYMAMALQENPDWRSRIQVGDDDEVARFVHEVRRYYPFVPLLGARARRGFEWRGVRFDPGTLVLLDVFGTHRDGRIWTDPGRFDPDRFRGWTSSGYDFIPQGGGDHHRDHRCAGEWVTIAVMKAIARLLCDSMAYRMPDQDLRIRLGRLPAKPASGVVLAEVRRTTDAASPAAGESGRT